MNKKHVKYFLATGLISMICIANIFEISANQVQDLFPIPDIEEFKADKYDADVGENITFSWTVHWQGLNQSRQFLFINFGNGSGLIDLTGRIEKGFVVHNYAMEGKYQVTLMATNGMNLSTSSVVVDIVNEPTDFNISLTTAIVMDTATYNFETDTPAPRSQLRWTDSPVYNPVGWKDLTQNAVDVCVRETDSIHGQVMELRDLSYYYSAKALNGFDAQESGIIEMWVRKSFKNPKQNGHEPSDAGLYVSLLNSGIEIGEESQLLPEMVAVEFRLDDMDENEVEYHDGSDYVDTGYSLFGDFDWYHVRVSFDCITETYDLFLNGFLVGSSLPYRNEHSSVNHVLLHTAPIGEYYTYTLAGWYIDSIGYSWEPTYTPGDNFAYVKNGITFLEDQQMYFFASDITDYFGDHSDLQFLWNLGNGIQKQGTSGVAYSFEDSGTYPITLTIIDDQGAINSKTIEIEIQNVVPEPDFKYTVDSPATYTFNYDLAEKPPLGWRIYDGMHYMPESWFTEKNESLDIVCDTPKVRNWKDGHYKVVELRDDSSFDMCALQADSPMQYGASWALYGTHEFWVSTTDVQKGFSTYLGRYGSLGSEEVQDPFWHRDYWYDDYFQMPVVNGLSDKFFHGLVIRMKEGKWQYSIRRGYNEFIFDNFMELAPARENEWMHVSIDFNTISNFIYNGLSADQIRLRVNDQASAVRDVESFGVKYVGFMTDIADHGYSCYVESLGLSWDEHYEIGDNWELYRKAFKGTHDFRFEQAGTFPDGTDDFPWTSNNDLDCTSQIIEALDSHLDVLEISDQNVAGKAHLVNCLLDEPEYGTIPQN